MFLFKCFGRSGSEAPPPPPSSMTTTPSSSRPSSQPSSLQSSSEMPKPPPEVRSHESRIKEWTNAFNLIDTDSDGRISQEELTAHIKALLDGAAELSIEEFQEVDTDGDGFISLEEFLTLQTSREPTDDELRITFDMFDADRDGFITREELHNVLVRLGDKSITRMECSKMIEGVDCNGDGQVDFQEFRKMMASLSSEA